MKARKRFGQNFLNNPHTIDNIVNLLHLKEDDDVVEIGPGTGALTKPLLEKLDFLHIIEIDRDLIALLEKELSVIKPQGFMIYDGDVLTFDFASIKPIKSQHKTRYKTQHTSPDNRKLRIVGNLPYNISTPLLFHLFSYFPLIADMHFMLQKEVVQRITAEPNSKAYGRLSVMIQYACKPTALFDVSPESFTPKPKVTSTFMRLIPHEKIPYPAKDFNTFKDITNVLFQTRRKTIHNSLKKFLGKEDFIALNIDPNKRAEQLSLEDFVHISNWIFEKGMK